MTELIGGIAGYILRTDCIGEFAADHRVEVVFSGHALDSLEIGLTGVNAVRVNCGHGVVNSLISLKER